MPQRVTEQLLLPPMAISSLPLPQENQKQQYCFRPQKLPASKSQTCLCPGPFMLSLWRWLEESWQWCSEEKEGGNGWRGYFVGYSCWGSVPI